MSHPGRSGGLDAVDEQPDTEPVVELGVVILATFMTYLDGLVPSRTCIAARQDMRQPPRPGGDSAERRQPARLAALLGFLESAVKGDRHSGDGDRVLLAKFPAVDLPIQPRNGVIDRSANSQLAAFPDPCSEVGAHGW